MIKNMEATYTQNHLRFYLFIAPVFTRTRDELCNFYIFDENGECWLEMIHTEMSALKAFGNGAFLDRTLWTIDTAVKTHRAPLVKTHWTQGNFDRGYALETVQEGLGLQLTHLTALWEDA